MSKNYSLILTNNYEKVNSKENLLCLCLKRPFSKIDLTYETVNFPELSKKEIHDRYNFCEDLYNSLFKELVIKLNSIHGISFSSKSWGVIIGRALNEIIQVNYKTFLQLDYTFKNYNINRVYTLDQNTYELNVEDTFALESSITDEEWFFSLCSKINNHFNQNKTTVSSLPKSNSFKNSKNGNEWNTFFPRKKIFNFLLNFSKYLRFFVKLENYGFIYNSGLPFCYEKLL